MNETILFVGFFILIAVLIVISRISNTVTRITDTTNKFVDLAQLGKVGELLIDQGKLNSQQPRT